MTRARTKRVGRREVPGPVQVQVPPAPAGVPLRVAFAVIALLTLAAYSDSFQAAFTMDSPTLIQMDTRVDAVSRENLALVFAKGYWYPKPSSLFRPVTTLSFLFNRAVLGNGDRPAGYHAVNLLLHALCVGLAFGVIRLVARNRVVAVLGAAVFATHPIATEAVTNIAGRADLLATASVLGGLLLHAEAVRRKTAWPWRAGLLATTLFGVFSKESAVVVVPAILLHDLLVRTPPPASERRPGVLGRLPWPSYAVLGVALLLLALARHAVLADAASFRDHFLDNPLLALPLLASRMTALKVMGLQLKLLVWPMSLSSDYSYSQIKPFTGTGGGEDVAAIASAAVVLMLLGVASVAWKRRPAVSFFILFYFAAILPTSNLLVRIGSVMAERFLYLPSVAFAALLAMAAAELGARLVAAPKARLLAALLPRRLGGERVAAVLIGVLVLLYAGRTFARNRDWRTEEALFRAARGVCPDSFKVQKGLAKAIMAERPTGARLDEAIAAALAGLRIVDARPLPLADQPSDLLVELARGYAAKGDAAGQPSSREARDWYERALPILDRAVAVDRAVNARVREALIASAQPPAEVHDVGLRRIYETLGLVRMRRGEHDAALAAFEYLCHLDPRRADGYIEAAWAHNEAGRYDDAAVCLLQAVLVEGSPKAWSLLKDVYRRIDPAMPALAEADPPSLNVGLPRVRAHASAACSGLIRAFTEAHRADEARHMRDLCVGELHLPPEGLDAVAPH